MINVPVYCSPLTRIPTVPMAGHTVLASAISAAGIGVLSHLLYFIRGEHHQHTLQLLLILCSFSPLCSLFLTRFVHLDLGQATKITFALTSSYLAALWSSIIIYRVLFHQLTRFPGPWPLKLSRLSSFVFLRDLDGFRQSYNWHQQYGNFVRTGTLKLVSGCI